MATLERSQYSPSWLGDRETLIGNQREANARMVQVTIAAQEMAEEAERAQARSEAAATALRASEERYRTLFELSPAAVYVCDSSGAIQQFNQHAVDLWGRAPQSGSAERFCGSYRLFRPDGDLMPHEECPMAHVVSGVVSEVRDAEVMIERPDGSRINAIVNIRALKNPAGNTIGAINCFYDITASKRAQELLTESLNREREVAQFREMFIGILGHDLRNPVAAISMTAKALQLRDSSNKQNAGSFARIIRSTVHMDGMITWLLDLARARLGGGLPLSPQPTDLGAICRSVAEDFGTKVRLDVKGDLTGVWDADRLEQVLSNLVRNAIEHGKQSSDVIIKACGKADHTVIEVSNQGDPIPPDMLPFIFQPFRRANLRAKSLAGNLGLGLYISSQIVVAHGGTLKARSADGTTTLVMRLPRVAPK